MSDSGFFHRESSSVIEISGPDSGRYLQSRTSNDILSLTNGESCLTACLSAQGKLEALFTAFCVEPKSHYLFISEGGEATEALEHLLRFKVADQFTAEVKKELSVLHVSTDSDARFIEAAAPLHSIPSRRVLKAGIDILVEKDRLELVTQELQEKLTAFSEKDLKLSRIRGKRPWFPEDISAGSLFLETPQLEAISSTKGCYPGQEVIEKALARGKPPKLLASYKNTFSNLSRSYQRGI